MDSVIRYTDRLWKALVRPARRRRSGPIPRVRGRLAPWVATLTRDGQRQYAVAVAEHSGLSLVFEVSSVDRFKPAMLAALCAIFEDMDLPLVHLPVEGRDIESASFVRLRDPDVAHELDRIEAICGTEFPYFPADLRRVQLNLNALPSSRHGVPREAAPLLFRPAASSAIVH